MCPRAARSDAARTFPPRLELLACRYDTRGERKERTHARWHRQVDRTGGRHHSRHRGADRWTAGVNLPGTAAGTAFQQVLGVSLSNQGELAAQAADAAAEAVDPADLPPEASETAVRVLSVIHTWFSGEETWTGCEFGANVSQAAQGLQGAVDISHCIAPGTTEGLSGANVVEPGPSANAEQGLGTADEASGSAASRGASNRQSGLEVAGQASGGSAAARADDRG